jgi:hypothetical protein
MFTFVMVVAVLWLILPNTWVERNTQMWADIVGHFDHKYDDVAARLDTISRKLDALATEGDGDGPTVTTSRWCGTYSVARGGVLRVPDWIVVTNEGADKVCLGLARDP